jgi:hypothetical protein
VTRDWVIHDKVVLANVETDLTPQLVLEFFDIQLASRIVNFEIDLSNLILVIEVRMEHSVSLGLSLRTAPACLDVS